MDKTDLKPMPGDTVKAELRSGQIIVGTYDFHPLAGECVRNQHGFPMNFKRIIEVIDD